jgi:hypothetical protein
MFCSSSLSKALISRAARSPRSAYAGAAAVANKTTKWQPLLGSQACRGMTMMSKQTAEEYKKTVRLLEGVILESLL